MVFSLCLLFWDVGLVSLGQLQWLTVDLQKETVINSVNHILWVLQLRFYNLQSTQSSALGSQPYQRGETPAKRMPLVVWLLFFIFVTLWNKHVYSNWFFFFLRCFLCYSFFSQWSSYGVTPQRACVLATCLPRTARPRWASQFVLNIPGFYLHWLYVAQSEK